MTERNIFMKIKKVFYLVIVISIMGLFVSNLAIIENYLISNINFLTSYYSEHTYLFLLIYFFVYVLLTTLSIPIALILGLSAGFIMDVYQVHF